MLVVGLILSSKRGDLPSRGVALVDRQKDTASALEDSVEHVERTKMLMKLRGRVLARQISSLKKAVVDNEKPLERSGLPSLQVSDIEDDIAAFEAEFENVAKLAQLGKVTKGGSHKAPASVVAKQKKLLDQARALAGKALADDEIADAKRKAAEQDEEAYKQALISAGKAHLEAKREKVQIAQRAAALTLLKKAKAVLKAREQREQREKLVQQAREKSEAEKRKIMAMQHKLDVTIAAAEKEALSDLRKNAHAEVSFKVPLKMSKTSALAWAHAADAAARGDSHAVITFCRTQAHSRACMESLARHRASGGKRATRAGSTGHGGHARACNAAEPGYFECLGVHDTGGTLG